MTTIERSTQSKFTIQAGELRFTFWPSGDLHQAVSGQIMLNQLVTSPLDGSLNNLYLRIHDDSGIRFYPLLGIRSRSAVRVEGNQAVWEGAVEGVAYTVTFALLKEGIWFWDIAVRGEGVTVDILYGQDLGIASVGAVRSNEAYLSQYIDHAVFEDEEIGCVVCSRQNQPQGGVFPYMQQGALSRAIGYSTDGFQFFGLSYKETNIPVSVIKPCLSNEVYQYECAYTALQSERVMLHGEERFVFYGLYKTDHAAAITELEYRDEVRQAWEAYLSESSHIAANEKNAASNPLNPVQYNADIAEPLRTLSMTEAEVQALFPERNQEERIDGKLLSFFTDSYEHVVLKEKELLVERPHGHIVMSGTSVKLGAQVITSTAYMYGIFNSHVVVGNTNFNKMMSNARNPLNVPKTSGQRVYIHLNGKYRLLAMPSMFEMGFNYARWYYKTDDDMLIVTNYTASDAPEIRLNVRSVNGTAYKYVVTNQVTMNVNEFELPVHMKQEGGTLIFHANHESLSAKVCPNLEYRMWVEGASVTIGDETMLASGIQSGDASLVVMQLDMNQEWTLTIQGLLDGRENAANSEHSPRTRDIQTEMDAYRAFLKGLMNEFHLSYGAGQSDELFKMNALAWWYTHNMLVHYAVPHGLEQYGGAAWGTRDVCQGPVEYFMATHKYEQVRDIVKMVYSHQYEDDGNWPQWFMFDEYFTVQQKESHGDIIVWPLKVLGDYLTATGDYSILKEKVPYTMKQRFDFTADKATILEHAIKEISYIRNHFLHDTHLSSYGDGDWDDTLQPANAQLKKYMISSWTVALTYQAMKQFTDVLLAVDKKLAEELQEIASGIEQDYKRYMLHTEVIPGFIYMEDPAHAKLMLHPTDTDTGIQYRLLPMTRSIIAELVDEKQAHINYRLIQDNLSFPDGVRLMNRPAQYAGGVSTHFKRAEQASNFGREVGLQYVHAHIRYVEAMAKLGCTNDAWRGLETINPVGIREVVPNAELRQSNAYFSSSDGKFHSRYEAQANMDALRSGSVQVKGGWRIYSSGPGIYMNQLIANVLGIRQAGGDLVIDPVLPNTMDGLHFDYHFAGRPVTFIYHIAGGGVSRAAINGTQVNAERLNNPYRQGGIQIASADMEPEWRSGANRIEIWV
ncbi:GH36-type glycosyl hydrolase domain-containing protein [Paenibacillus alvei]|uniref:GH36-type glycosyl hydrolase domain-containing protein n=1 Tax=Paenibacillus alvei TaxID=44250 RepID=UPI0003854491|nr:hypothetical protein [Paenibacillus alvei]EPY14455.1 hypothetical protein PAAL66ix_02561 [Paenibacillus alvei A6-6i-x]